MKQLHEEYPDVPEDVTALIVQTARLDLAPGQEVTAVLGKVRRILGESVMLQAMRETAPARKAEMVG
jgi:hypothetical protein